MENIYSNISSIVPGSLRSLTSHLEERESPIRNFLYDRFPNTRPAFADARAKLASAGALDVMRDRPGQPDSELVPERCLERLVIAGTPESVADQILAFGREVGEFGTLLYTGHDWVEPALARRSMELMACEVIPRVNKALALP